MCFLVSLNDYKVDTTVSKAHLRKFSHHLRYFREKTVILSLSSNAVDNQTKMYIIANLIISNYNILHIKKRFFEKIIFH